MNNKSFSVAKILYLNIVFILLMTIIFGALFGVYFGVISKPVYVATKDVIASANIDPTSEKVGSSYAQTSASLAETLLPTVERSITSTRAMEILNEKYKKSGFEGSISRKQIEINYNTSSLIFTISYSDYSEKDAEQKLDFITENMSYFFEAFEERGERLFSTGTVFINSVQNSSNVSVDRDLFSKILLGAIIGFVVAVCYVFVVYLLDNKISSEDEIVEITGEKVFAFLNK